MKPQLLQEFEQNKGRTGDGIGGVGASSGHVDLQAEYAQQQGSMNALASANGVKKVMRLVLMYNIAAIVLNLRSIMIKIL